MTLCPVVKRFLPGIFYKFIKTDIMFAGEYLSARCRRGHCADLYFVPLEKNNP